jgi:NitT/TauT family transport system permease protein
MKRPVKILVAIVFWGLVWQVSYMALNKDILLSSPAQVVTRLIQLSTLKSFWISAGLSLFRILLGFLLGVVVGAALAVLTSALPLAKVILEPALTVIRATPVTSFVLLALIFLSSEPVPVLMAFLMVLPIVWSNVSAGIVSANRDTLEMASAFKMGRAKKVRYIYLPSVLPYFTAACRTSIGLSWKAGIAAEVLGTPKFSIGTAIYSSKIYLETVDLFAWTTVVILLSLIFEKMFERLVLRIERREALDAGD